MAFVGAMIPSLGQIHLLREISLSLSIGNNHGLNAEIIANELIHLNPVHLISS